LYPIYHIIYDSGYDNILTQKTIINSSLPKYSVKNHTIKTIISAVGIINVIALTKHKQIIKANIILIVIKYNVRYITI